MFECRFLVSTKSPPKSKSSFPKPFQYGNLFNLYFDTVFNNNIYLFLDFLYIFVVQYCSVYYIINNIEEY